MSVKRVSPTANLLRSSRLFAVPQPLPPPVERSAYTVQHSDTATQLYPTHAAIATPSSSLHRCDWGIKRSLPERATSKSSNPVVRIHQMDTWEKATDFASAGDHYSTLKKWQDMNVPITVPEAKRPSVLGSYTSGGLAKSVFEDHVDNTSETESGVKNPLRWKFQGPWLAGKTEGEFLRYLKNQIRGRRAEFQEFLRKQLQARKSADQKRRALERGEAQDVSESPVDISAAELQEYIVSLRYDEALLSAAIHDFLDLPASNNRISSRDLWSTGENGDRSHTSSPYAGSGPPKTHPSAGLSYLRTASHISNHPILGPQANPPPVKARILQPRKSATSQNNIARLGIAGVVADDNVQASFVTSDRDIPGLVNYNPFVPGGPKMYVRPTRASIDSQGRIMLSTERVDDTTVQIHEGTLEKDGRKLDLPKPQRRMPTLTYSNAPPSSRKGYGLEGIDGKTGPKKEGLNDELRATYKSIEDLLASDST